MVLLKDLFTINEPIGRGTYAARTFSYILIAGILLAFLGNITAKHSEEITKILLVLLLILATLFFTVVVIKRYWDIVSSKKNAIILGICTIYIIPIIPVIGGLISLITTIALFFIPGKEV
jgi:uncharacterized membrane protein YhaH (DUF805 family)